MTEERHLPAEDVWAPLRQTTQARIGLGRMGGNMVKRLLQGGHKVVAYDRDAAAVEKLVKEGATGASSLKELVSKLDAPRAVWVMVPAGGPTESTISVTRAASSGECASRAMAPRSAVG